MDRALHYKNVYQDILQQLKALCVEHYRERLISVVVFGSIAKKTFGPASDIDLLLVFTDKRGNYEEFSDYYDNVESKLVFPEGFHIEINPIFKSKGQLSVKTPYLWNTEFLILYDREGFFREFMAKLKKYKENFLVTCNKSLEYTMFRDDEQRAD
jgi:hypothetical protein